jgi:hypothetical protein
MLASGAPKEMANILIVYYYKSEYPIRATSADHLYCFENYAGREHNCFYLNVAVRNVPRYLKEIKFDLVIYATLFFSLRWDRQAFKQMLKDVSALRDWGRVKVAMPQDEFLNTDLLSDFIGEFGIDIIFSASSESEWGKIYEGVDFGRVKIEQILTGYLDEKTLKKIKRLAASSTERPVDVGYRAWRGAEWLGRHGLLKAQISDVFEKEAPAKGIRVDVSTRPEDTFLGDSWYKFLLRCKYIIGVEGGASILDRDGTVRQKTDAYIKAHPAASFDEIEANCFPGLDGSLRLFAISPRHLEACATRTCQVLVEGEYNGILTAGRHYIELKRDFSNLEQVLDIIKRDDLRQEITDNAYSDVVGSGLYTYRSFVGSVIKESLAVDADKASVKDERRSYKSALSRNRLADRLSWLSVMFHWYGVVQVKRRVRRHLLSLVSERTYAALLRPFKGEPEV